MASSVLLTSAAVGVGCERRWWQMQLDIDAAFNASGIDLESKDKNVSERLFTGGRGFPIVR